MADDIKIRPADLVADRALLIASLLAHLTPRSTERRFRWFYEDNPHGRGSIWVATHGASERVVGSGSIVPRMVSAAGVLRRAAVMADFWIHPEFRALGPAIKLQRACIEGAAQAGFAFFDLPQGNMPAVYRRMRLLGQDQLLRLAKPLRTEAHVRRLVRNPQLAHLLASLGDVCLRTVDAARARNVCDVARHDGSFGTEFSTLANDVSRRYGFCVARSAEYLTWRYGNHYYLEYETFTARRHGGLLAYAVVVRAGTHAEIVDLFGHDDRAVITELLLAVANAYRARALTLAMAVHAATYWVETLMRCGFRVRDSRALVIHSFEKGAALPSRGQPAQPAWFLSYGDIDY